MNYTSSTTTATVSVKELPTASEIVFDRLCPEERLYLSVLTIAARDYITLDKKSSDYRELCGWISSNDIDYPFSLLRCCEVLNFCPKSVRRKFVLLGNIKLPEANPYVHSRLHRALKDMKEAPGSV